MNATANMAICVSTPSLKELYNLVMEIGGFWESLGYRLGLRAWEIDNKCDQYRGASEAFAMLQRWCRGWKRHGMEKTTFPEKLRCYDWATGKTKSPFPRFPSLICLKCRDMPSDYVKAAIVVQLLPDDVLEDENNALFKFIQEKPEKSDIQCVINNIKRQLENVDLPKLIIRKSLAEVPITTRRDEIEKLKDSIARRSSEEKRLYFWKKELACSPNSEKLGFLTTEPSASRTKRILKCSFLHKTFAEYSAARCLSEQLTSGDLSPAKYIEDHSDDISGFAQIFLF